VVRVLLRSGGPQLDEARDDGYSPLYRACLDQRCDLIRMLLNAGAYVDVVDSKGLTSLFVACHHDRVDVARLLLEARADARRKFGGWSARDLALRAEASDALQQLLLEPKAAPKPIEGEQAPTLVTATASTPSSAVLDKLRSVALQARAQYETIYDAATSEHLDAPLTDLTTGELLSVAKAQCDWLLEVSHGAAASDEAGRATSEADAEAGDEMPDWLLSAAMQLGSAGAGGEEHNLADTTTSGVGRPAPLQRRPRRMRKTAD
jgi:hypothetical protein